MNFDKSCDKIIKNEVVTIHDGGHVYITQTSTEQLNSLNMGSLYLVYWSVTLL